MQSNSPPSWPANETFWRDKRVTVTGGGQVFFGSYVVEKLEAREAVEVFAPRLEAYDLTQLDAIRRMLTDAQLDVIIHLAARVGGIGANRERPAEFFYDNLIMGVHLMHEAWRAEVAKFAAIGTVGSRVASWIPHAPRSALVLKRRRDLRRACGRRSAGMSRCGERDFGKTERD
jgi:nucleoside-diphosphate-sugar epimerase